jgi:hypothetical protein
MLLQKELNVSKWVYVGFKGGPECAEEIHAQLLRELQENTMVVYLVL